LWAYIVTKQTGIAELKSRLSEFLRLVQSGESIAVLDRNRETAQIVRVMGRPGIRIHKPAPKSPKLDKIAAPRSSRQDIDVLDLLLEERRNNR
jgi:antitoxin (DNA-binding transcriptional repressor) of toxin-antitoxin stability system